MKLTGFLLFELILSSCTKQRCSSPVIGLSFAGFNDSDLTRVVIIKYKKNTNFTKSFNSTIYNGFGFNVDANYDYIVNVIVTGEVYSISGISLGNETMGSYDQNEDGCTTSMTCTVNGANQYFSYIDYDHETDYIALKK